MTAVRPLKNAPFCPISAPASNFSPRNTQCIHPKGTYFVAPVVKIFVFLDLAQKGAFFKGLATSTPNRIM